MQTDKVQYLCGRLRAACVEILPCEIEDMMEALAIVAAEMAHSWPKLDDVTTARIVEVYAERAGRYAARLDGH